MSLFTRGKTVQSIVVAAVLAASIAAGALIGNAVAAPDQAAAHSWYTYYDLKWPSYVSPTIRLGNMDNDLDGNATKRNNTLARTNTAKTQWNNVAGPNDFGTTYWSTSTVWAGDVCSTALWGNVTVVGNNISALMRVDWCGTSSNITRASVRVDYRAWDNLGGSVPSTHYDYQAVMTHELGHATGWGYDSKPDHFTASSMCPDTIADQTMCAGTAKGETFKRSLETHDKHTWDNVG